MPAAAKAIAWWKSLATCGSCCECTVRSWPPLKVFFYRSSNTIAVVQARGVLIMTLARFQIPTVEYPPMQIKLALAGSGHADKGEVQDAVMRELRLNERPKPDDAADALAVGLTAWFQR